MSIDYDGELKERSSLPASPGTTLRDTMKARIVHLVLQTGLIASAALLFAARLPAQDFTVLYNFTRGSDGADPNAGLSLANNTLYGTTAYGGSSDQGTIFLVNTDGTGFKTLHTFGGRDG